MRPRSTSNTSSTLVRRQTQAPGSLVLGRANRDLSRKPPSALQKGVTSLMPGSFTRQAMSASAKRTAP